jgi:hypothetical protein
MANLIPTRLVPKLFTVLREGYGWPDLGRDALAGLIVGIVALPLAIAFAIGLGALSISPAARALKLSIPSRATTLDMFVADLRTILDHMHERHCVSTTEIKVILQPINDLSCFCLCAIEALGFGECYKLTRRLASLSFYVV